MNTIQSRLAQYLLVGASRWRCKRIAAASPGQFGVETRNGCCDRSGAAVTAWLQPPRRFPSTLIPSRGSHLAACLVRAHLQIKSQPVLTQICPLPTDINAITSHVFEVKVRALKWRVRPVRLLSTRPGRVGFRPQTRG